MIEDNRYYWSHLKTRSVTVSVSPSRQKRGIVFRVGSIVDLGTGRQTVMLENVDYQNSHLLREQKENIAVPLKMGTLDFVYASGKKPCLRNVKALLTSVYKGYHVEEIVLEVLTPGDLLVFEQDDGASSKMKLVSTLRAVKENSYQKSATRYAL